MTIVKTALVAAALVAVTASANAQSREELNSGYHGTSPVYSSPYGPRDEIDQNARDAFGRADVYAPRTAPRYQPRQRQYNGVR